MKIAFIQPQQKPSIFPKTNNYVTQPQTYQNNHNLFHPPRPSSQKLEPLSEPMDIDSIIHKYKSKL